MARRLQYMSILDTPGIRSATRAAISASTERMSSSTHTVVGTLHQVESDPEWRAQVDVLGGVVWLGANPGAYTVNGGVVVQVENGRPTWVVGPTETPNPDADAEPYRMVLKPAAMLDQGARDAANNVVTRIGRAFVTSTDAPTPEDGEDRPNGAIWTRTNPDGTPAARWKWDQAEGAWVSVPVDEVTIFSEAFIDHLATNDLLAQRLTLTSEVDGWLTRVSGLGLETYTPDGTAAIRLGNFDDEYMQLATSDGMVGVSIDQEGGVNAITGSFGESLTYRGVEIEDRLQDAGRVIARGGIPGSAMSVLTEAGERAIMEISADAPVTDNVRHWELTVGSALFITQGTGVVGLVARYTSDGSTPNLDSPILGYGTYQTVTGTSNVALGLPLRIMTPAPGEQFRILISYLCTAGVSVEPRSDAGNVMWARIIDRGRATESVVVARHDRRLTPEAPAPVPPPAPAKKRYSNVPFSKTWHKVWQENGDAPGAVQGSVVQGYTPYYPAAGIYRSMVGFESMTTALSGADIESIQVRVRAEHWYSHAGGRVDIGLHGASSSTAPGSFTELVHGVVSGRLGIGGEVWLTIPREYYAGFRNGTYRGITVYRASADPVDYGKFTASRFAIRATYVK